MDRGMERCCGNMMRRIAVLTYLLALLAPLTLATVRLLQTAGNGPLTSVLTFSEHPFGDGALRTSLVIASLSTLPDGGDRHALGMVARPP